MGFVPPVDRARGAVSAVIDALRSGRAFAFALTLNREVIGFAMLTPGIGTQAHTGLITSVMVDPGAQGAGLGRTLMAADEPGTGTGLVRASGWVSGPVPARAVLRRARGSWRAAGYLGGLWSGQGTTGTRSSRFQADRADGLLSRCGHDVARSVVLPGRACAQEGPGHDRDAEDKRGDADDHRDRDVEAGGGPIGSAGNRLA